MQKQVKFNSMMGKGGKERKNIEQSYSNGHLKFLFREFFLYTLDWSFSLAFWIPLR